MDGNGAQVANRAAKFLSRFAAQRIPSPSLSLPRRASHYDQNRGYTPTPDDNSIDRSADYWSMHIELQEALEKNEILQSTTAQELYHAQVRVDEANEARRRVEEGAKRSLKEAIEYSTNLNNSLEEERSKVRDLLQATKKLEESMRAKRLDLMAEVAFQEKRAEDIQQSGVRLQLLAEETLRDAGEQTAEANREVVAMRKSLTMARAYKLHTTLEQVTSQFSVREDKLKRMIAHLQADKAAFTRHASGVERERDMFKEHLRAVLSEDVASSTPPPAPTPVPAPTPTPPQTINSSRMKTWSTAPRTNRAKEQVMMPIRSDITGHVLAVKITKREDDIIAVRSVVSGEIIAVKIQ
jgi:hypothetical protein